MANKLKVKSRKLKARCEKPLARALALPPRCAEGLSPSVPAVKASAFKGSGACGRKGGAFPPFDKLRAVSEVERQVRAAEPQRPLEFLHTFREARDKGQRAKDQTQTNPNGLNIV